MMKTLVESLNVLEQQSSVSYRTSCMCPFMMKPEHLIDARNRRQDFLELRQLCAVVPLNLYRIDKDVL
jgi:hypothetical protein